MQILSFNPEDATFKVRRMHARRTPGCCMLARVPHWHARVHALAHAASPPGRMSHAQLQRARRCTPTAHPALPAAPSAPPHTPTPRPAQVKWQGYKHPTDEPPSSFKSGPDIYTWGSKEAWDEFCRTGPEVCACTQRPSACAGVRASAAGRC